MADVAFAIETVRHFFSFPLENRTYVWYNPGKGDSKADERSREGMVMSWAKDRNNTLRLT